MKRILVTAGLSALALACAAPAGACCLGPPIATTDPIIGEVGGMIGGMTGAGTASGGHTVHHPPKLTPEDVAAGEALHTAELVYLGTVLKAVKAGKLTEADVQGPWAAVSAIESEAQARARRNKGALRAKDAIELKAKVDALYDRVWVRADYF